MGIAACPVRADERTRPFQTTTINVYIAGEVGNTSFHERWAPKTGGRIELEMPFYSGESRLGVHLFKNSAKQEDVPGFRATYVYLGWGGTLGLGRLLAWSNGVNVGDFFMDFAETPFEDVKETESELGFGIDSRLAFVPQSPWSASVGVEYRVVLTNRRLEYLFVSLGIGRRFETPGWLREFLE